ncbi:hypothetical protein JIR001_24860 [Polycladomyces abyssicola]|uniref:MFS transporter n=1 Tax=Polycladomyces abyssicola TaxID=1125966 RepID=A0A8D5UIH2_9BACL|nr:MFS transporter [Polycladomyces abyssicola]BCU82703.1 hypothetical protein JIR001_24860 [Polycladomyces abyssicola]
MKVHLFLPLKVRPFRLLITGQIFSDLGNWLDFIALNAILVFQWKMGPGEMGIFLVVFGLPWIVCGPLLAVWSDRYPRKTIMIGCDIARVLLVLGLYWVDNFYLLLLLVFLKGTCGAMFDPVRQGMIRSTVPADLLKQANALSQTVLTATKVLGPSLGAALLTVTSPQTAFLVEAVGFVLSACSLIFLPKTRSVLSEGKHNPFGWNFERESVTSEHGLFSCSG